MSVFFHFHNNLLCFVGAKSLLALDRTYVNRTPGKLVRTKTDLSSQDFSRRTTDKYASWAWGIATNEPLKDLNNLMDLARYKSKKP
jgi:hypothetical protein